MGETSFWEALSRTEFVKLAQKFPLEDWDNAGDLLLSSFSRMVGWLAA
jgi:hypothetical protein